MKYILGIKCILKKKIDILTIRKKLNEGGSNYMKFMKGILIGGIVTAGIAMIYAETMDQNKKKMMKLNI